MAKGQSNLQAGSTDGRGWPESSLILAIAFLLAYQGYTLSIVGVAAPWIASSFKLSESGLARMFAWMSLAAFGALALARLADKFGRRRIILLCLASAPIFAASAAVVRSAAVFTTLQMFTAALLGGSVSSAIVLLAEELPVKHRARGQAYAALASAAGGVLGYILIPFLLAWGYSWRWLMIPCAGGLALLPLVLKMLPADRAVESQPGDLRVELSRCSRFYDVLHPLYRRRALALLSCAALDTMAGTAVNGWLYFEAVSIIGLSPRNASTLVVAGMVFGMIGFPAGAWTAERFGRVPTVSYFGGAAWIGAVMFYLGPPRSVTWPLVWLLIVYCWFKFGSSVMTVGANSAATELFPASLRATMIGWQGMTAAIFAMLAQLLIAVLIDPLGGLNSVVRYFALLGFPSAAIFRCFIEETRDLPIHITSREDEWAQVLPTLHYHSSQTRSV